ncbi:MAG TPA: B-box zinc finger protein [Methanocella sp.]|jgi:hypothetical protein
MQCDVHKDKVAVGFCEACGRMVCRDCAVAKDGKLLCREDAAKLEQEAAATVPSNTAPIKRGKVSATVIDVKSAEPAPLSGTAPAKVTVVSAKVIEQKPVPAADNFHVDTVQKPADNSAACDTPPMEEATLKVVNSPQILFVVTVLIAVSLVILILTGLAYLLASSNHGQDLSLLLYILIGSFVVTAGLVVAAWKYYSVRVIKSAFRFRMRRGRMNNAIVAEDGIYLEISNNLISNRYRLLPWSEVRIQAVNEAEKAIGLKSKGNVFRLDDRGHFEELRNFLVRYAAHGEPVNYVKKKTPLISPGRLAVIMFALVIAYLLITAYVEGMPTINPANDHKCDYDGVTSAFEFYTLDTAGNEVTTLEICNLHGVMLAMLHPDLGLLEWSKVNAGLGVAAIIAIVIMLGILATALYYSMPRWRRILRYVMV